MMYQNSETGHSETKQYIKSLIRYEKIRRLNITSYISSCLTVNAELCPDGEIKASVLQMDA